MTEIDESVVLEPEQPKAMTLPQLRKFDGQLFIINNTPNKITFHEKMGDKSVDFELDPAGEEDSMAFMPKLALDMRGLQKLWMRGAVTISTDPEMENRIMLLNAQAVGASDARMQEMLGIQTANNNHKDIEEKLCLVCGRRNPQSGVIEIGRVMQTRRQVKDGTPPLCPAHVSQVNTFVPRLAANEKGDTHWEFDQMQLQAVNPGLRT
ncbi:MAG TPA: hypothetical protein VGF11_04945 [Acidimicrobiales bacterium]